MGKKSNRRKNHNKAENVSQNRSLLKTSKQDEETKGVTKDTSNGSVVHKQKGNICETNLIEKRYGNKKPQTDKNVSEINSNICKQKSTYPIKTQISNRAEDNADFDAAYGVKPKKGNSLISPSTEFPWEKTDVYDSYWKDGSYDNKKQYLNGKDESQIVSVRSRDFIYMRECEYVYDAFCDKNSKEVDTVKKNKVSKIKKTNSLTLKDKQAADEKSVKFTTPNSCTPKQNSVIAQFCNETETDDYMYGAKPKRGNLGISTSTEFKHENREICYVYDPETSLMVRKTYDVYDKKINGKVNSNKKQNKLTEKSESLFFKRLGENSNEEDKDGYRNSSFSTKPVEEQGNLYPNLEKLKENMFTCVNAYLESKGSFSGVYDDWLQTRRETLKKLKTLVSSLHEDQLNYNKAQMVCREVGFVSRGVKCVPEKPAAIGFMAVVSAFLSDAASGIASVAQAVNVESYRSQFQEIVDHDAQITKDIYNARSRCVVKYQGVEEVMRKYQSSTFSSTVGEVSDALEVGKFWTAVKAANQSDDLNKIMGLIGNFVDKSCHRAVIEKIRDSVETYVDDNPAALDACKSAGRAVCSAMDSLGANSYKRNSMGQQLSLFSNQRLMLEDKLDIGRLKYTIDRDLSQTKLEDQIQDAIDSLKFEMEEIIDSYKQQLQDGISNDDSDDIYNKVYDDIYNNVRDDYDDIYNNVRDDYDDYGNNSW